MENRYSLVINPHETIIDLVKIMKNELAQEIGWFHSKNSLAHITINEFMANENEIESIKKQLDTICESLKPVSVYLNAFDHYPNGAFFIAPDAVSKIDLKQIMKHINQSFPIKTIFKNNEPHLSIARKLTSENISKSYRLFSKPIDLKFECKSIALRLFNPKIKQFEIIAYFEFRNNPKSTFEQGTLF